MADITLDCSLLNWVRTSRESSLSCSTIVPRYSRTPSGPLAAMAPSTIVHEVAAHLLLVVGNALLRLVADRPAHHRLDLAHPHLDRATRVDLGLEGHDLLLGRDHVRHLALFAVHGDGVHRLEAFAQVRLHSVRILGLREDRDELVIGEEVEAGKGGALGLQVVGQILLHALELGVGLCPRDQQVSVIAKGEHMRRGLDRLERLAPQTVDHGEALGLGRQLPLNILRVEDGLEIHPAALASEPLEDALLHHPQLPLPVEYALLERSLVRREGELLSEDDVVVEQRVGLVRNLDDAGARAPVRMHVKVEAFPRTEHDLGVVQLHALGRVAQSELVVWPELRPEHLGQRVPVAVAHAGVAQRRDDRHVDRKDGQVVLELLGDGQTARHALERLDRFGHRALHRLELARHIVRVELEERAVEPLLVAALPAGGVLPQEGVGLEVLDHLLQPLIVGHLHPEERLPLVEQRRLDFKVGDGGLDVGDDADHLVDAREVRVLVEVGHTRVQLLELLGEGLLLHDQLGLVVLLVLGCLPPHLGLAGQ
eukprot:scaffold5892_cov112-Isochrysis_galbana.AAC.15